MQESPAQFRIFDKYDLLADIYNDHWGKRCLAMLPAVQSMALNEAGPKAKVLDLCCGSGQFSKALWALGYRVYGLDGSARMIEHARKNHPTGDFRVADAREFSLEEQVDAAICLCDSLNHIVEPEHLRSAFASVYAALAPGGVFFFDLRMEEAFMHYWNDANKEELINVIEDRRAMLTRSGYDAATRLGRLDAVIFNAEGDVWRRYDIHLDERYYPAEQLTELLQSVGFGDVREFRVKEDLGYDLIGRSFFRCRKPAA